MEKVNLSVEGMSCNHCVARVEEALSQVPGVSKVKVHLKKGQAKVQFDENQATTNELINAIQDAGYKGGV